MIKNKLFAIKLRIKTQFFTFVNIICRTKPVTGFEPAT